MSQVQMEMIEQRVDWLTASSEPSKADRPEQAQVFLTRASRLLEQEERRGNPRRPWKIQSCIGWAAGGVSVAWSDDMAVARLSGETAANNWREIHEHSTNVSRIDLAATFRTVGVWRDMSFVHLDEVRRYAAEHKPHLRVTRIDGGARGNTLQIGSRTSDAYGRIYDKERESKDPAYKDAWRYEVEFKRERAKHLAAALASGEIPETQIAAPALSWLRSAGVVCTGGLSSYTRIRGAQRATSDGSRCAWMARCCRPTVTDLISRGKVREVLEALFEPDVIGKVAEYLRGRGSD